MTTAYTWIQGRIADTTLVRGDNCINMDFVRADISKRFSDVKSAVIDIPHSGREFDGFFHNKKRPIIFVEFFGHPNPPDDPIIIRGKRFFSRGQFELLV